MDALGDLEKQSKRVTHRTKRDEKKLEKRIQDFESGKFDWISNRYPLVCDHDWNQQRNRHL